LQHQADALEVQQQRVGAGVVRPQGLVVELARIVRRQRESAPVKNQVAADFAQSTGTKLAQQQPELFEAQLGIATAAQVKVAVEPTAGRAGLGERFTAPGMRRAEQFKASVSGQQFHDRGRVHGLAGIVAE
jgi:hypothetical protein